MTPVVVQAEVDIKRSPQAVFDYCSDPSHEPEWNPMMKRAVKLTDGPARGRELVTGPSLSMLRPWSWSASATSARAHGP